MGKISGRDRINVKNVCLDCLEYFPSVYKFSKCPNCSGKLTHVIIEKALYIKIGSLSNALRKGEIKVLKLNIHLDGNIIASFIPRRNLYRILRGGKYIYVQYKGDNSSSD